MPICSAEMRIAKTVLAGSLVLWMPSHLKKVWGFLLLCLKRTKPLHGLPMFTGVRAETDTIIFRVRSHLKKARQASYLGGLFYV